MSETTDTPMSADEDLFLIDDGFFAGAIAATGSVIVPGRPPVFPMRQSEPGELRVHVDTLVRCPLIDPLTARVETRPRPVEIVVLRLLNLYHPGSVGEPDPTAESPGYTVEEHPRVRVISATSAQELIDMTMRFIPKDAEIAAFLARVHVFLTSYGVPDTAIRHTPYCAA